MAGNVEGDAAKSGRADSAHVKASKGTYREDDATRYALFLTQVCIKMFWRSLYAVAAGSQEMTTDEETFIYLLSTALAAAEILVQAFFVDNTFGFSKQKTTGPLVCYAGCGVAFVFAYGLCSLPSVASIIDVLRAASWVGFVFNFGCLVELGLGPFQKCVVALADARRD